MTSVLGRLAVPLIGACLVLVVIIVGLVVLDLGGSPGNAVTSLTAIQIGGTASAEEADGATSTGSTTVTVTGSPLEGQGQGSGSSLGIGQGQGTGMTGSTVCAGKTTVVTGEVRVQPGHGHQGSSTSGTTEQEPSADGNDDGSTGGSGSGSGGSGSGSGSGSGGMHGPPSTGHGR